MWNLADLITVLGIGFILGCLTGAGWRWCMWEGRAVTDVRG